MRSVKLNRDELLGIVRQNKDKHVKEYAEAVEDYKAAVIRIAKANLKLANTGDLDKIAKMQSVPGQPVSYEDSYNRSIRMLELSVDEVIELQEDVFNQLVLDEWTWKRSFTAMGATYKSFIGG